MSKQARTIVLFLGVVAVIIIVYKLVAAHTKAQGEKEFKRAYAEDLAAEQVWCEACGETSPMRVMFKDKAKFQVCPKCGAEQARPIVYYVCMNEACNKKLLKVANHVMIGSRLVKSPDAPFVCPECGQAASLYYEPLHLDKARKIAEETGQEFP